MAGKGELLRIAESFREHAAATQLSNYSMRMLVAAEELESLARYAHDRQAAADSTDNLSYCAGDEFAA